MEAIIALVLLIPSMILRGVVISTMWAWFIVPLGVDPITLTHGIGLSFFMSLFVAKYRNTKDDDTSEKIAQWMFIFMHPLVALLFGWIVHSFMN